MEPPPADTPTSVKRIESRHVTPLPHRVDPSSRTSRVSHRRGPTPRPDTPQAGARRAETPAPARRRRKRGPLLAVMAAIGVAMALFATWVVVGTPEPDGFGRTESMAALEDEAFEALPTPESIAPVQSAPVRANGHAYVERPEPATMPSSLTIPAAPAPPPAVTAKRAVVLDAATGAVLWGLAADEPAPMASTVKILTALTVLRFTDPGAPVTVTEEAAAVGEREIYLAPGEQMDVSTLLGAMLVGSANDAAAALGLHVGGTMDGYSAVANWLALRLGALNTHVANPHGLDQPGHVTSAHDLAILARAGLADPTFAQWVRTPQFDVAWPGHPGSRVATSHNKLLRTYPGAIGVKTGMTNGAGNCLVGAATRDGRTFIVVSMSSQNPTADDTALLDWAFANYTTVKVVAADESLTDEDGVEREPVTDLLATVPTTSAASLSARYREGRIQAVLDGQVVSEVDAHRAG